MPAAHAAAHDVVVARPSHKSSLTQPHTMPLHPVCSWYRSTGLLLWPRSKRLLVAAASSDLPYQLLRLHTMLVSLVGSR